MIAPRGLFVMGNPGIVNLAPDSEKITVRAGAEIYSALGARDNISYSSNTANGTHCVTGVGSGLCTSITGARSAYRAQSLAGSSPLSPRIGPHRAESSWLQTR